MTKDKALQVLINHQKWRKGCNETPPTEPKELSAALEVAIGVLTIPVWSIAYRGLCEIREIYCNMEGFLPKTAPEGYVLQEVKRMYDTAVQHIRWCHEDVVENELSKKSEGIFKNGKFSGFKESDKFIASILNEGAADAPQVNGEERSKQPSPNERREALDWLETLKAYIRRCRDTDWSDDDEEILETIRCALECRLSGRVVEPVSAHRQPVPKFEGLEEAIDLLGNFVSDRKNFGGATVDDAIETVCRAARWVAEQQGEQ